ncbi:sex-lethal [Vespula maculifrons]|uniref:Sex-lethal n=1 Tax=Vespula maculifrons TaxID=7453 RepID=A0ABD2BL41_VESMC
MGVERGGMGWCMRTRERHSVNVTQKYWTIGGGKTYPNVTGAVLFQHNDVVDDDDEDDEDDDDDDDDDDEDDGISGIENIKRPRVVSTWPCSKGKERRRRYFRENPGHRANESSWDDKAKTKESFGEIRREKKNKKKKKKKKKMKDGVVRNETKRNETRRNETRRDEARPDQSRLDQTRLDQTRPVQTRPDQTRRDKKKILDWYKCYNVVVCERKRKKEEEKVDKYLIIRERSDSKMSTMSVVSNSSVEVDSDSSNDLSSKDEAPTEQKFILRNELYNSLLASALGKTVLNRHLNLKEQGINFNLANLKDNLNALGALKDLKDLKGLTVSSVPAFPRNLALHREDHDEIKDIN